MVIQAGDLHSQAWGNTSRVAAGHEPHLWLDWFHRHVDRLVVEAS